LIKIRYQDLPAGLHVRTEATGRSTVIYLLPGLTHAERRAALLRARRSAQVRGGPRLTASGVAAAVVRDRLAATARNGVKAFRAHPMLLLPPLMIAAGATLIYVMLSAEMITFPQAGAGGPSMHAQPGQLGAGDASQAGQQIRNDWQPPGQQPPTGRASGSTPPGRRPPDSPPAVAVSASPAPSATPSPGPSQPSPASPSPSGSPTAGPGSPVPSPSATCIGLGPLSLCLN
jgi:hypothetical protein